MSRHVEFGKFKSLKNTLTDSRSNMSLSSCLLLALMSNTYTYTYTRSKHNKEDDDLQLLTSPFITARKITGIYNELHEQCVSRGWSTWLFPAQSLWRMLGKLGIKAGDRKMDVGRLGQAAEKTSNWLWMKREEKSWSLTTGP